jgi:hypothetical protein
MLLFAVRFCICLGDSSRSVHSNTPGTSLSTCRLITTKCLWKFRGLVSKILTVDQREVDAGLRGIIEAFEMFPVIAPIMHYCVVLFVSDEGTKREESSPPITLLLADGL